VLVALNLAHLRVQCSCCRRWLWLLLMHGEAMNGPDRTALHCLVDRGRCAAVKGGCTCHPLPLQEACMWLPRRSETECSILLINNL